MGEKTGTDTGAIVFGPFRLLPGRRLLLEDGKPVRLGSRALDILITLVGRPDEIITKRELMEAVWPDTFVVEANLTVHMTALRRTLDDQRPDRRYIINVPGRGYRFAGPVVRQAAAPDKAPKPLPERTNNLPAPLNRLLGRSTAIAEIRLKLEAVRLLTVVGPPGIGKTACALAIAREMLDAYSDGVWFLDLSPITAPSLLPSAMATALGLDVGGEATAASLVKALHGRQMLIVVDNCEHLVDAAADFVMALLRGLGDIRMIATSREALRVEGEHVYRLPPLAVPQAIDGLSSAEALSFAAVELFVERAAAASGTFELLEEDAATIARICTDLDGIPLAIEFAACRIEAIGLAGLRYALGDRASLTGGERRGTSPRHRTILDALEWSYDLLMENEQKLLRMLSVFAGGFSPSAAADILGTDPGREKTADILSSLVSKSLVSADARSPSTRFRLLEITRDFAGAKLDECGETAAARMRHADIIASEVQTAYRQRDAMDFVAAMSPEVDNLRTALATAAGFGDPALTLRLAAAAAPLFFGMSLLAECRHWMSIASALIDSGSELTRDAMEIQTALASAVYFTRGLTDEAFATWTLANEFAERLGDIPRTLDSLMALWTFHIRAPDYAEALSVARRYAATAATTQDPGAQVTADWIFGTTYHHLGQLPPACQHLERFLATETDEQRLGFLLRTGFDRRSASRGILANTFFLRGEETKGLSLGKAAVEEAQATGKALPLCEALMWRGVTAYLAEDIASARSIADEIREQAGSYYLDNHYAFGLCLQGLCDGYFEPSHASEALLADGIERLDRARYGPFHPLMLAELARMKSSGGRPQEAIELLSAHERRTINPEGWCTVEFLRRKAALAAGSEASSGAQVTDIYREAAAMAERQKAVFWARRVSADAAIWSRSQKTAIGDKATLR